MPPSPDVSLDVSYVLHRVASTYRASNLESRYTDGHVSQATILQTPFHDAYLNMNSYRLHTILIAHSPSKALNSHSAAPLI